MKFPAKLTDLSSNSVEGKRCIGMEPVHSAGWQLDIFSLVPWFYNFFNNWLTHPRHLSTKSPLRIRALINQTIKHGRMFAGRLHKAFAKLGQRLVCICQVIKLTCK